MLILCNIKDCIITLKNGCNHKSTVLEKSIFQIRSKSYSKVTFTVDQKLNKKNKFFQLKVRSDIKT